MQACTSCIAGAHFAMHPDDYQMIYASCRFPHLGRMCILVEMRSSLFTNKLNVQIVLLVYTDCLKGVLVGALSRTTD